MNAIRTDLKQAISDANAAIKAGTKFGDPSLGHVYISDWRFNPNRDMSDNYLTSTAPGNTDNAWDLIYQLMQTGIRVRIMLWFPSVSEIGKLFGVDYTEHQHAHTYIARLVREANNSLMKLHGLNPDVYDDMGVVFLDTRLAEINSSYATHHQKFIVINSLNTQVAYCGGVDLAYTRRSAPLYGGDSQSGNQIPPHDQNIKWSSLKQPGTQDTDLPLEVYGSNNQIWHDQHLRLRGEIVTFLEKAFVERWNDDFFTCYVIKEKDDKTETSPLSTSDPPYEDQAIISSSANAFIRNTKSNVQLPTNSFTYLGRRKVMEDDTFHIFVDGVEGVIGIPNIALDNSLPPNVYPNSAGGAVTISYDYYDVKPLPDPIPITTSPGTSTVQLWKTIPLRTKSRTGGGPPPSPYARGEFSLMAGITKACNNAQQLILIFDQYFWSLPYARLLAKNLTDAKKNNLYVIIILPPHADGSEIGTTVSNDQHRLRQLALQILPPKNVLICSLWDFIGGTCTVSGKTSTARPLQGIYCHAKVQLFDDLLLVCGSCNLNDRSLTCDSEMSCAVYDSNVVQNHYRKIWQYLFNQTLPTSINFSGNWGATFFSEFTKNVAPLWPGSWTKGNIMQDPWNASPPTLPNGIVRGLPNIGITDKEINIFSPNSIPKKVQNRISNTLLNEVKGTASKPRDPNLQDVIQGLENSSDVEIGVQS